MPTRARRVGWLLRCASRAAKLVFDSDDAPARSVCALYKAFRLHGISSKMILCRCLVTSPYSARCSFARTFCAVPQPMSRRDGRPRPRWRQSSVSSRRSVIAFLSDSQLWSAGRRSRQGSIFIWTISVVRTEIRFRKIMLAWQSPPNIPNTRASDHRRPGSFRSMWLQGPRPGQLVVVHWGEQKLHSSVRSNCGKSRRLASVQWIVKFPSKLDRRNGYILANRERPLSISRWTTTKCFAVELHNISSKPDS